MISNFLSVLGVAALLAVTSLSATKAWDVVSHKPSLPDVKMQELDSETKTENGYSTNARPPRANVYYAAITDRPIFTPGRRPGQPERQEKPTPVAIAKPSEPAKIDPPELALLGVMGQGKSNRALISSNGAEPAWINENTEIDGWTVTAIGTDWLDLSYQADTIRIEMYQQ